MATVQCIHGSTQIMWGAVQGMHVVQISNCVAMAAAKNRPSNQEFQKKNGQMFDEHGLNFQD